MKKVLLPIIILGVFVLGLLLGDSSYTRNQIVDDAMDKFEEEIQKEDNEYANIMLKPNSNVFNKLAEKIEKLIDTLSEKIKDKM